MMPLPKVSRSTAPIALITLGAIVLLVGLAYLIRHRGDSDVLPPTVVKAIKDEKAARPSIDSIVGAERYKADMANAERVAAEQHAAHLERAARVVGHRADSLAAEARASATARDSAMYWHLAYASRTTERDTLLVTIAVKDTALTLAAAEARALRHGLAVADSGRHRADSVLDATVAAATNANCRVPVTLGLVRCPARRTALVVGVVLGVTGKMTYDAVRDGRVKISLPFVHANRSPAPLRAPDDAAAARSRSTSLPFRTEF